MRNYISIEPVQLFYGIMAMVSNVVRDQLFVEKVCRVHLGHGEGLCGNLSAHEEVKHEVQTIVAELEILDGVLVSLPALLFSLFMGSWSDRHGRKILLILPFAGNILAFLAYIANYYFFFQLGIYHLLWGSCVGLFGGYISLNIGLYGYLADVSSSSSRTTRLSILNGVTSLSFVIGNLLGGQIFSATNNYYLIFGLSILFGLLGMGYAAFFVKESVERREDDPQVRPWDLSHVRDCFRTTFKDRRPSYPPLALLLLSTHFSALMFCLNTSHYDYLLLVNKFDWTVGNYSNFLIAGRVLRFLGLFALLPLLSSLLRVTDELITLLGSLITASSYIIMALGSQSWTMFLALLFQFNSIVSVSIRSQVSKAVDGSETGKAFAVLALGQSLVPLVANPLFGLVYRETLRSFPGAYLLIVSGLLLLSSLGASYVYLFRRRVNEEEEEDT